MSGRQHLSADKTSAHVSELSDIYKDDNIYIKRKMPTTFTDNLKLLPEILQQRVADYWRAYEEASQKNFPLAAEFWQSVCRVWATSDFVAENCVRFPDLLKELFDSQDLLREYAADEYRQKLTSLLQTVTTEEELAIVLRRFRRREMLRIVWRDLAGFATLQNTTQDLSALADACIDEANRCLYHWQCQTLGIPADFQGSPQKLIIIALGKLGGEELNLSSDVDLIFCYPTVGETSGVSHPISHEQFFNRLGQRLIHVLNAVTSEGFVFRVDMRLRPLGASGPLVMHFDAMKNYYDEQGRDWERYALVKARVIGGDKKTAQGLMAFIYPFVYRRYLDFGTIESLRQMHALIHQEARSKKLQQHVKLGEGGIREIEFIGQTFQLIRGGQETELQDRRILPILKLLEREQLSDSITIKELTSAYTFLRNVEHRLQAVSDRQTHQLPEEEYSKIRLAYAMGFGSVELFEKELNKHRANVSRHFKELVAKPEIEKKSEEEIQLQYEGGLIWLGEEKGQDALNSLQDMGFDDCQEVLKILQDLRESFRYRQLAEQGKKRVDALMPPLLMCIGKSENPLVTLKRLITVLEAIMRRGVYLALLLENPKALSQLVQLCAISPWLTDQLARYPLLLGELLDVKRLYAPLNLLTLEQTLSHALALIPKEDLEEQMECLRRFKLVHLFRVAAMDITSVLPLMRVSDHLTNMAEVILRQVEKLAWHYLGKKQMNFGMVAYGKLGGIELGYGSDLDLVFLYEDEVSSEHSDFYLRLGQRMLNMLATPTTSGILYEVDTRLRPSGEAGLLVSSLQTFEEYQLNEAWTWEHQALVRARMISGTPAMQAHFSRIRQEILAKARDPVKLRADVQSMRQKMREASKPPPAGLFDLKQGNGGIADIEFIVQYGVLRFAHDHAALLEYPDNIRILESFAGVGVMEIADVRLLSDAYRAYRAMVHRLNLQNQPHFVQDNQFRAYREGVQAIWHKFFNDRFMEFSC